MEENKTKIDNYILQFPIEVQAMLNKLRQTIKELVPEAEEKFSYQMPTFICMEISSTLLHIKTILDFTRQLAESMHLKVNYRFIKVQRGQCNSLLINHYRLN